MSISKLKKIISILLEQELETDFDIKEPYGKVLFARARLDNVDKSEPDTIPEDDLKDALRKHYNQSGGSDLEQEVPLVLDLIDQGKYTEILKPPSGYVYRILSNLDIKTAANLIGVAEEELIQNASNKPWIVEKPVTLNPIKGNLQSWTYNLIKLEFGQFDTDKVEIIFEANTGENTFFMNPRAPEKISFLKHYKDEYETVSVGPVKCSRVLVYYTKSEIWSINYDLLNKYVNFINKKGKEIEEILNNKIVNFYHKHGMFLNTNDIKVIKKEIYEMSTKNVWDKMDAINDEIDLLNEDINNQIVSFMNNLLELLKPFLRKDFRHLNKDLIIGQLLGLYDRINFFPDVNYAFSAVSFNKLQPSQVEESIVKSEYKATRNNIANIIFRAFQRKQKY